MNGVNQLQQKGAKVAVCSAHLLILPSKLFLEKITLCKLVQEAPFGAGARFHVHTLITGEVIAIAEVECCKVPCCMVKILKPPAQSQEDPCIPCSQARNAAYKPVAAYNYRPKHSLPMILARLHGSFY